jgi:DNA polymerase (family X)
MTTASLRRHSAIAKRAAERGVAMQHNANPNRLDLCDRDLRYGIRQLRRAWLTPEDVLNTRGADEFLKALRPRL